MSDLDPQAPSQPSQQTGLNQSQNPASQTSKEQADSKIPSEGQTIDHREGHDVPSNHGKDATNSSLGYGDTGSLKEKQLPSSDAMNYSKDGNLEGEQMRAPGEGEVADAVQGKTGGGHKGQESLTQDLDDKTKDHADELHRRGERTGAEMDADNDDDWTDKKADIEEALSGRGTKIVLAAEQ